MPKQTNEYEVDIKRQNEVAFKTEDKLIFQYFHSYLCWFTLFLCACICGYVFGSLYIFPLLKKADELGTAAEATLLTVATKLSIFDKADSLLGNISFVVNENDKNAKYVLSKLHNTIFEGSKDLKIVSNKATNTLAGIDKLQETASAELNTSITEFQLLLRNASAIFQVRNRELGEIIFDAKLLLKDLNATILDIKRASKLQI